MGLADKWRTQPMYTFGEAARLAKVSPTTVKNWFHGNPVRQTPPLFPSGGEGSMISFLQLIESVVAARFRNSDRVPYRNVYAAYQYAQERLGVEYPFAHLKLEPLGGHIIARLEGEEVGSRACRRWIRLRNGLFPDLFLKPSTRLAMRTIWPLGGSLQVRRFQLSLTLASVRAFQLSKAGGSA